MNELTVAQIEVILDDIERGMEHNYTEAQLIEMVNIVADEESLTEMDKFRRDNPTLNDAWEQIKTIRNLTHQQQKKFDDKPAWERHYFEIVEGTVTENAALREAWNQYYTLKMLLKGKEND